MSHISADAFSAQPFHTPWTPDDSYGLNGQTLMVFNLADFDHIPYQAAVLDQKRGLIAMHQNTKALIRNYIDSIPYDLEWMRAIKYHLNIQRKMRPITNGAHNFVSLGGSSSANADWIGLHHLLKYNQADSGQLTVFWAGGWSAEVSCSSVFDKLYHDADLYSQAMQVILEDQMVRSGQCIQTPAKPSVYYNCDCIRHSLLRDKALTYEDIATQYHTRLAEIATPKEEGVSAKAWRRDVNAALQAFKRRQKYT